MLFCKICSKILCFSIFHIHKVIKCSFYQKYCANFLVSKKNLFDYFIFLFKPEIFLCSITNVPYYKYFKIFIKNIRICFRKRCVPSVLKISDFQLSRSKIVITALFVFTFNLLLVCDLFSKS